MENRYVGLFDDATINTAGRVIHTFIRKYEFFFGSLDFDDLLQECLLFFNFHKIKYWQKAEAYGMSQKAYLVRVCRICLSRILRDGSSRGRGHAAALHRDFGDRDSVGFNDAGDLDIVENLFVGSVFVDAEGGLILQDACLRVYKSLNGVGRKVFVLMVNFNLTEAEISRELGYSHTHIHRITAIIRKKASKCFFV